MKTGKSVNLYSNSVPHLIGRLVSRRHQYEASPTEIESLPFCKCSYNLPLLIFILSIIVRAPPTCNHTAPNRLRIELEKLKKTNSIFTDQLLETPPMSFQTSSRHWLSGLTFRDRGATLKVVGLTSDSKWGGGGVKTLFLQYLFIIFKKEFVPR